MPLVKSFCHTRSAQMEKSQRGRGLSYFSGFFFSPTGIFMVQNQGKTHHISWNICRCWLWNVYTWDKQTTWYGWALPCGKSYHYHSFQGYSDVTIYYFEASQYLIFSILKGGCKVTFCYKNMHWYFVGICFTDLFLCRTYEQLIKMMLGNLTNTSGWSHKTFNPQGIKINTNNSLPQQTFCLPRSPFNLGTFHTPQKCLY